MTGPALFFVISVTVIHHLLLCGAPGSMRFFSVPLGFTTPQEVPGCKIGPHLTGGETETRGYTACKTGTPAWGFGFKTQASLFHLISPEHMHFLFF